MQVDFQSTVGPNDSVRQMEFNKTPHAWALGAALLFLFYYHFFSPKLSVLRSFEKTNVWRTRCTSTGTGLVKYIFRTKTVRILQNYI